MIFVQGSPGGGLGHLGSRHSMGNTAGSVLRQYFVAETSNQPSLASQLSIVGQKSSLKLGSKVKILENPRVSLLANLQAYVIPLRAS